MDWFFIALVGPFLWALVNHIDKYMLHKYFYDDGVYTLMIFSCLSSVLALPVMFYFNSDIFGISLFVIFSLIGLGLLSAIAFFYYLKAVELEDLSVVIPLFQLLPIFTYFLSYFILGESLTLIQLISAAIIMLGAISLSLEVDIDHSFIFKKRVLILVAISTLCFALNDVLFKKIALDASFWTSAFWQYVGLFLYGVLFILFSKTAKARFKAIVRKVDYKVLSVNITSEVLYMIGNLSSAFATLLAPVTLVLVVGGYQPLFVFLGAILMTILMPKIVTERISRGHLIHRTIAIIVIFFGSYLLYTSSN